jgi:outer membrane protein
MRARPVLTSIATLLLASVPAVAEARTLTVEEAVQLALDNNPVLQSGAARVRGDEASAKSVRSRMLPSIHVTDEFQHWDSPFSINFGQPFTVRDQNTNTFTAAVDQPLLQLLYGSHDLSARSRTAEASGAALEAARAELRAQVETYFVQVFEARALEQIAKASEEELGEQVTIAEARLKAGVLTQADVLRVQVSAANAKEQEIQAHGQGEVARANLLGRIGLPIQDRSVDFAPPTQLLAQARAALPSGDAAERIALEQRPEVKQRNLEAESAHENERARMYALLPDIDAEGAFIRTDGSIFNPANAAFVGVKAQWAIWEWGASNYTRKAAEAQADSAHFNAEDQKRRVAIEVASDLAQATSAAAAVDVARQTITSAEEAYRVTKAALQAGTATTTDLLDAQAALTQARLNLTRAEYEDALSRVTLRRGLGTR